MAKLAEAADSKSVSLTGVWVQVPPLPPSFLSRDTVVATEQVHTLFQKSSILFPATISGSPTDRTDIVTDSNRPPAQGKFDGKALAGDESLDGKEPLFSGVGHDQGGGRKTSDGPVGIVASGGPPPLSGKMVKSTNLMRCWPSGWVPDFQSGQTGSTPVRRSICAIDIVAVYLTASQRRGVQSSHRAPIRGSFNGRTTVSKTVDVCSIQAPRANFKFFEQRSGNRINDPERPQFPR